MLNDFEGNGANYFEDMEEPTEYRYNCSVHGFINGPALDEG
jgi:hypothetical protein